MEDRHLDLTDINENVEGLVLETAQIASYVMQGDTVGMDYILRTIDEDASWENAATFIGILSSLANVSQWGIGEILYFLRHRYNHETIGVFPYQEGDAFPSDLVELIRKKFSQDLEEVYNDENKQMMSFLGWTAHKFTKFWLLIGKGEVRVWRENENPEPTTEQWEDMIRRAITPLVSGLNEKTAWALYSNAVSWPRHMRREHLAWTIHYETKNLEAGKLPPDVRGDERHSEAGKRASRRMEDWEASGTNITTTLVRNQISIEKRKRQGWCWRLPEVEVINVEDLENGGVYPAILSTDPMFQIYILFHTRLSTIDIPTRRKIRIIGTQIEMDGEFVGELINLEVPAVDAAISKLVKTLRWEVAE
jgi:hypothetical protein